MIPVLVAILPTYDPSPKEPEKQHSSHKIAQAIGSLI